MGTGGKECCRDGRQSVRDLRVAEVVRQDVTIEDGKISGYRVRIGVSFKYEKE